ncbi:hypothetical protein HFD88_008838 [Aspergillus terreus]|nr:hypothetical protein HFD88_008838 [Aspergillus terreus]
MYPPMAMAVFTGVLLGPSITTAALSGDRRSLPETLLMVTNEVKALGFLGASALQEVDLLVSHLLDLSTGKKSPVTSVDGAIKELSDLLDSRNSTFDHITYALDLVARGLLPSNVLDLLEGVTDDEINSSSNINTKSPSSPIYPQKAPEDAPYSVDEATLRSALYIPSSFEYGANGKTPVLLVPGTAVPAGLTYHFNFVKLLSATSFADPVWVNIPGNSLDDVQVNAEYVAYAINYLSGVSNDSTIGVISWSQGGLDTQWALKYWSSTRAVVRDFMPVSPDFHGTLMGGPCPGFPSALCTPSLIQQAHNTSLLRKLRSDGGDSAYVPTTTLYSSLDEVVQPQIGTEASAFLHDARAVGVTNNQMQLVCPGQIAGSVYTHESMLVNPVAWALVVDALTHDGPGEPSRTDLDTVCGQFLPPGLTIDDFLGTETTMVAGVVDVLKLAFGTDEEPPIKPYAL